MNTNYKRFAFNCFYTIFVGLILYWGTRYEANLFKLANATFNEYPRIVFSSVFPILIGFILAIPQFIKIFYSPGVWKIDWIKLVSIGLPAFYISLYSLHYLDFLPTWFFKISMTLLTFSTFPQQISSVIFGYVLLTSFYKENENITMNRLP